MLFSLRWRNAFCGSSCSPHYLHRLLSNLTFTANSYPVSNLSQYTTRIQELCRLGRVSDARNLFDGMPHRDTIAWNSMIFGYSLNDMMADARTLFDSFAGRNTRTWTILVSGYAKNGCLEEAQLLFDSMPERNTVSWNAMISGYVQNGDVSMARHLFDEMPVRDIASWNAIITGYCHFHQMSEARKLFEQMRTRDLVSWTVMISGYVQVNEHGEGWKTFLRMQREGVRPDQSSFIAAVSAIMGISNLKLLENLRTLAIKTKFESDIVVGTAILNAYTKDSGGLNEAVKFFELMKERNEYSWSTMISTFAHIGRLDDAISVYERDPMKLLVSQTAMLTGYAQNGWIREARILFEQIPNPSVVSWNAMIAGYAHNHMLDEAKQLFNRMPTKNAISWSAMIAGCAQNGENNEALHLLSELHRLGALPSLSSLTTGFFACGNIGALEFGRQLHSLSLKAGSQFNSHVNNGLITMYAKCKNIEAVSRVFNWMGARDTVSWNSLITALFQNNMLEDARIAFDKMSKRDVVSWTAIISAYIHGENWNEALKLFLRMLGEGILPNSLTIASVLSACGNSAATNLGRQVHGLVFKLGYDMELFVGNALITMYFKCGCAESFWVFDEMAECDIVTWNSVLAGCAQHGLGREALEIFEQMKAECFLPNAVTFLVLLCACSHGGLVDEGWHYFKSMSKDYGIMPSKEHYASMVDLLGRAGYLSEAEEFIENMPIEPDSVVWGALLGSCRIHQNVELGRRVAERLFSMDPQDSGNYVLLSNLYASLGMWDEVEEVRKLMVDRGVVTRPGCSWTQMKKKIQSLYTGNNQQEQIGVIYDTIKEFYYSKKGQGRHSDVRSLQYSKEEQKKIAHFCQ
ncbi:pentatricopeptide repeat-containing protein [Canna indica]|uniref:Pentatricopeptide repeat-containing protein n=1 Tax=Canna indica TaxID=4628 RepID=A0AAQ3QL22_9LILI|nr:pentatricopeptide repeat-containing protein [Canna indica]